MLNITEPAACEKPCNCKVRHENTKLIVLTGGPGAGKTAVLEIIRKQLCGHVVILPEAASIVFGGGFWRLRSVSAIKAAQRAILHIQQECEALVIGEHQWALGLCDRGLLDGLAYWPGEREEFWRAAGTDLQTEYGRYHAVIHLRTPGDNFGYNHDNPLRTESVLQAQLIDHRISQLWSGHPRYYTVESAADFLTKAQRAIDIITLHIPDCCSSRSAREGA